MTGQEAVVAPTVVSILQAFMSLYLPGCSDDVGLQAPDVGVASVV